jgi:hypothetical protein
MKFYPYRAGPYQSIRGLWSALVFITIVCWLVIALFVTSCATEPLSIPNPLNTP